MNINSTPSNKIQISNKTKIKYKKNFFIIIVNNHVKIHQSAIQKYTTLETAKIQKACYKSCCVTKTSKWYTFQWQWRYTFGWLFTDDQVVNFYVVIYTSRCINWKKLQIPQKQCWKNGYF